MYIYRPETSGLVKQADAGGDELRSYYQRRAAAAARGVNVMPLALSVALEE